MDDPRLTPARPDLAAQYLEGRIKAERFVTGERFEISDAIAPLRGEPCSNATLLTQALKGERVTIYDRLLGRRQAVVSSQIIYGNSSISLTITANAAAVTSCSRSIISRTAVRSTFGCWR